MYFFLLHDTVCLLIIPLFQFQTLFLVCRLNERPEESDSSVGYVFLAPFKDSLVDEIGYLNDLETDHDVPANGNSLFLGIEAASLA